VTQFHPSVARAACCAPEGQVQGQVTCGVCVAERQGQVTAAAKTTKHQTQAHFTVTKHTVVMTTYHQLLTIRQVKCLPVLLYGTDARATNTTDLRSLEFTVKRVIFKLFCTYDNAAISSCMSFFGFPSVTEFIDQCTVCGKKSIP